MKFKYKSQLKTGEIHEGIIEATDKFSAAKELREKGEIPLSTTPLSNGGIVGFLKSVSFGGISLREKIMFTKNVSGMLQAGLSLSRALTVVSKQTKNQVFKRTIETLSDTMNQGGTLSDGMQKIPETFSTLFVAMVRAGEESGSLGKTLEEIGETLQKSYALNKKIKSAMTYPTIIVSAIAIIGVVMLIYVVPTLTKTFAKLGSELPASTRFVIWLSDMIKAHFIGVFLIVGVFIVLCVVGSRLKKTKRYFDTIILGLPVIGTIVKEVNTARTARTLSSLLSSGVPMAKALSITHEVLQNYHYQEILQKASEDIEKGKPLSESFKSNIKLYPVMMGEMMEVGEETGNLSKMLLDIALFYEGEVDTKTKDLSTIVEPVLMVFIGGAVGFFAISMISPMYSVLDSIK